MPAIASVPPDGISSVVSARRTLTDGMVAEPRPAPPEIVTAPSPESSDTSVMTLRLMRPSVRTTGVKFRLTPNFLYETDWVQTRVTGSQLYPVSTGNSPPARKVALSPEIAVRFGSASVRITPAVSIARIVAETRGKPVKLLSGAAKPAPVLLSAEPEAPNGLSVLKLT